MWFFRTGEDGLLSIILFQYTETRAKFNAEEFLKGFKGYLETDGYQGYNNLPDIRCCFSNNLSENAIRPFTAGRKNWLFSDTPKGAEASAVVYTMVEMAKAHHLNIYKYLNYLLEHLPGTKMTDAELVKLDPWNENIIANCSGAI